MNLIFPKAPAPQMSDRYVMIDTNEVIANMQELGYQVAEVRGPKYRNPAGRFGYHMVDFRLERDMKPGAASESPRALFINSYNGVARAKFVAGLIRWVCTNGLVAGDMIASESVLHIGDAAKDLISRVSKLAAESYNVLDRVGKFKGVQLSKAQALEFTRRAAEIRFEKPDPLLIPLLNTPRRSQDVASDLWTTFNRVQENIFRGGLPYQGGNGVVRLTAPIRDVQRDSRINRDLWDLMETFAEEA